MAWGVFVFTKEGRQQLANVLRALLICQLIVSLCMIIFCYNSSVKAMMLLKHINKVTVVVLYSLIILQSYCMKLHYTSGLRLLARLLRCPHWERNFLLTQVWMVTGLVLAANGCLVYYACRTTLQSLLKELFQSLRVGISQYLTEPSWKRLLDTMQVELSCCGAEMPGDWHEIPWINMDCLNEDSSIVIKLAGADGKILPPVTPFSCCAAAVLPPCWHDPLQQSEHRSPWGPGGAHGGGGIAAPASLHALGCVEALRGPLTRALLALQLCMLLALLLQLVVMALTRLLRGAVLAAVLRGDADAPAPAAQLPAALSANIFGRSGNQQRTQSSASLRRRRRRLPPSFS